MAVCPSLKASARLVLPLSEILVVGGNSSPKRGNYYGECAGRGGVISGLMRRNEEANSKANASKVTGLEMTDG